MEWLISSLLPRSHRRNLSQRRGWLPWACAVAAGIALMVSLTRVSSLNRGLAEQQERLNQQLEQLKVFQRLLSDEKEVTEFIAKPGMRITPLAGTDKSPQAAGTDSLERAGEESLFLCFKSGRHRQRARPINCGSLPTTNPSMRVSSRWDPDGNGFLKVPSLSEADKAQKFAVTLEPAGGVPQPTGDMHLLGSL